MKARESYRNPDGTITTSSKAYIDAWTEFLAPLKEVYGLTVIGFDPGASVCDASRASPPFELPTWFIRRLHGEKPVEEAMPCPFCGNKKVETRESMQYEFDARVRCGTCEVSIDGPNLATVLRAWNQRA
jgi:hypothetical protein